MRQFVIGSSVPLQDHGFCNVRETKLQQIYFHRKMRFPQCYILLLWVPCQGLTLATMFLKPTRSPVCHKTVTARQPAANASPSMKYNLFLPLCLFPLIFPSSTNFSSPPFLCTCPTNLSCLFLMVITKLLSMPTISSICSFEILFTHDIRIILR